MPKGRPALAGVRKFAKIDIGLTDSEKVEIESAAAKMGKRPATWARDELLRLAREINGPAVKPAKKKTPSAAKKPKA